MFKKSKVIWVIGFLIVACVAAAILISVAVKNALTLPLKALTPTSETQNASLNPVGQQATPVKVTPVQSGSCGQVGTSVILVIGYDTKVEPPFGADGVRLVRVDYDRQLIHVLSFPRNMWMVAPVQVQANLKATTLGELYQYGLDNNTGSQVEVQAAAGKLVVQAIYDNFGVLPDHYLIEELNDFGILIDAIGGIDIDLPVAYTASGRTFNAGPQLWDGATTLAYVRSLNNSDTEWTRFDRQNQVLRAIRSSMMNSSVLSRVPELTAQFNENIVTDLSLANIASLSCISLQLPSGQIVFSEIGPEMVQAGPGNYVLPDYDKVKPFLMNWLAGK